MLVLNSNIRTNLIDTKPKLVYQKWIKVEGHAIKLLSNLQKVEGKF